MYPVVSDRSTFLNASGIQLTLSSTRDISNAHSDPEQQWFRTAQVLVQRCASLSSSLAEVGFDSRIHKRVYRAFEPSITTRIRCGLSH